MPADPAHDPTDAALAARAAGGDESAFSELVSRYKMRVFGTASRYARGRHELDDLAQDIFLRIWKGLPSYRADAPFEHWCMRVVVRSCYDFLRKNRRRRESEVLVESPPIHSHTGEADRAEIQRREAWETVSRLLERLNAKDRLVITLIDLEEKSVREAASLTGWSESNVKVRAHRARKKMREIWEQSKG